MDSFDATVSVHKSAEAERKKKELWHLTRKDRNDK